MAEETNKLAPKTSPSDRFAGLVLREYNASGNVGAVMTENQKRLVQNYFIATDRILAAAEQRRLAKSGKWQDPVPCTWQNVDMNTLALDAAHYSRMGLDPLQKNHLHIIPFKNNKSGKYDVTFMEGYEGKEVKAKKYALEIPKDVTFELVFSNDNFIPHKKDATTQVESYEFDIKNPFDRGELKGGFGYIQYEDPTKNKLIMLSLADIEKRANSGQRNVEFWGGEKDTWENGKKAGKVHVDGWYNEMCLKTIKRAVYDSIAIDPAKIDDAYEYVKRREMENERMFAQAEIDANANQGDVIDAEFMEVSEPEALPPTAEEPAAETAPEESSPAADEGPGF